MTVNERVEAVVFDMDGLLIDSETLAMESLMSAGAELGYDLPMEFCRKMIGVPADQCRELTAHAYGAEFPISEFFDLHETHLHRLVETGRIETKPGAAPLLEALERQAIPKAIATSSSRERAERHLRSAGIAERFDIVITRQDVTNGKPHPEPYVKATAALGRGVENTLCPGGLDQRNTCRLRGRTPLHPHSRPSAADR